MMEIVIKFRLPQDKKLLEKVLKLINRKEASNGKRQRRVWRKTQT